MKKGTDTQQMKPLSAKAEQIPFSGIRRFFDIAAQMDDVISLGVGEPGLCDTLEYPRGGNLLP